MTEKEAYEQYDEYLDEIGSNVHVQGIAFAPSQILKVCDPVAYRCGFNDWCNSEGIDLDELE